MGRNEDLYQEMEEQEEAERQKYGVAPKPILPRRLPNEAKAKARFQKDIAPVLKKQKKAEQSPIYRAFLRFTGQLKPEVLEVSPVMGMARHDGMTTEEVRQEILAHPELYPDLVKKPPTLEPKK